MKGFGLSISLVCALDNKGVSISSTFTFTAITVETGKSCKNKYIHEYDFLNEEIATYFRPQVQSLFVR